MWKKGLLIGLGAMVLSGCSLTDSFKSASKGGSVWKSTDGGKTFEEKINVDDAGRLTSADILTIDFHPTNSDVMYMGTVGNGIFRTTDGAERWQQMLFPPLKNYGFAVDQTNGDRLFVSGVYNSIAKMYRTENAGEKWEEVYTEPGPNTVITALASNSETPDVVYAGTSAGVIIKSENGGRTWRNVAVAKGPVTNIVFEKGTKEKVTLLVFNMGTMVSLNGGTTWTDNTGTQFFVPNQANARPDKIVSLTSVGSPGILYAGAHNGLFKSTDDGKTWTPLNIIESSKKFPIRAVDINPSNPSEIIYASGNAFYKSTDGGAKWSTTQLEINRGVSVMKYDPRRTDTIYIGLRKF